MIRMELKVDEAGSEGRSRQAGSAIRCISSRDLLGDTRELEIDHEGRIYRLRLTQSNKLILTA